MFRWDFPKDELRKVVLSRLTEDHAVNRKRSPERLQPVFVPGQRQHRRVALYAGVPFSKHPIGNEAALTFISAIRDLVCSLPWVQIATARRRAPDPLEHLGTYGLRDVLPHGVAVVAVNASLSLLQVNGIGGQIPVYGQDLDLKGTDCDN